MLRHRLVACLAVALLLVPLASGAVSASTMTFTGLPSLGISNQFSEDGIVATANSFSQIGSWSTPNTAHMDSSGTGFPQLLRFTIPGNSFNATSFDIIPDDEVFSVVLPDGSIVPGTYENVRVRGFRDTTLVAEQTFFMGTQPSTYYFGSNFTALTSLVIYALEPQLPRGSFICADSPCSHFNIDNVKLNPVPVPGALLLFAGGLGFLWFGTKRRGSSRSGSRQPQQNLAA